MESNYFDTYEISQCEFKASCAEYALEAAMFGDSEGLEDENYSSVISAATEAVKKTNTSWLTAVKTRLKEFVHKIVKAVTDLIKKIKGIFTRKAADTAETSSKTLQQTAKDIASKVKNMDTKKAVKIGAGIFLSYTAYKILKNGMRQAYFNAIAAQNEAAFNQAAEEMNRRFEEAKTANQENFKKFQEESRANYENFKKVSANEFADMCSKISSDATDFNNEVNSFKFPDSPANEAYGAQEDPSTRRSKFTKAVSTVTSDIRMRFNIAQSVWNSNS